MEIWLEAKQEMTRKDIPYSEVVEKIKSLFQEAYDLGVRKEREQEQRYRKYLHDYETQYPRL